MNDVVTTAQPGPDASGFIAERSYDALPADQQSLYSRTPSIDGGPSRWQLRTEFEKGSGDTSQPATLPRPSWAPESTWDPASGLDHTKFDAWYRENVAPALARHEADEARRAALPQKPDDYQVDTSPAFRLPPGDERVLDVNDPFWSKAKDWALKHGVSKDSFKQAVDLIAARDTITRAQVQRARAGEIAKLGPTGPGRLNAIEAVYRDLLGADGAKAMMSRVWTAGDVKLHEVVVAKFATRQGTVTTQQQPGISDEAWAGMDAAARYNFAKSHSKETTR